MGGARVERDREGTVEGVCLWPKGIFWPEGASAGVCLGVATAWLLCGYSALAVCLLCACHALTKMCNLR